MRLLCFALLPRFSQLTAIWGWVNDVKSFLDFPSTDGHAESTAHTYHIFDENGKGKGYIPTVAGFRDFQILKLVTHSSFSGSSKDLKLLLEHIRSSHCHPLSLACVAWPAILWSVMIWHACICFVCMIICVYTLIDLVYINIYIFIYIYIYLYIYILYYIYVYFTYIYIFIYIFIYIYVYFTYINTHILNYDNHGILKV